MTTITRKTVTDFIRQLGYDPDEITEVRLVGNGVEVTRFHYIVDPRTKAEREADDQAAAATHEPDAP